MIEEPTIAVGELLQWGGYFVLILLAYLYGKYRERARWERLINAPWFRALAEDEKQQDRGEETP